MSGFALLWGKILESSLWIKESKETRLVWVTLLAMKDRKGKVQASLVGLADRAKVTVEECREALRVLTSPDADDTSKVEEGRRIREVAGGWEIINHELYRFSTEARRAYWAEMKALQRKNAKNARKVAASASGRATPEEVAEAHEEVRRTTINSSEAEAENLAAMRRLDELQGGVEMPEP